MEDNHRVAVVLSPSVHEFCKAGPVLRPAPASRVHHKVGVVLQGVLLAQALELPKARVVSMVRRLEARDVSLDAKVFDDSATTLADTLLATDASQEERFGANELGGHLRDLLRDAVAALDKRERYIVEKRLMADSEDELSLAEIGRRLGVSRERARQLEARAKRKLKTRIGDLGALKDIWLSAA